MNAAVFAYSRAGIQTAKRVSLALHDMDVSLYTLARLEEPGFLPIEPSVYALEFSRRDALIFVGACGIAVREIAPYVRDKKTDPAVLVLDERARHVIPLLSGHIGGANRLTVQLSSALGAEAVITTATDVNGKFAVDEFAARAGCAISDMQLAKAFAAGILEREMPLCSAFPIVSPLPGGVYEAGSGALGVYIGCDVREPFQKTLRLIPKKLRVGLGCRRGVCASAITSAIQRVFAENRLDLRAISGIFSIDLKKDEPGLLQACRGKRLGGFVLSCADLAGRAGRIYGVKLRRVYHRCGQRLRAGGHGGRGAAARFKNCDGRRDRRRRAGALGGTLWVRFLLWASAPVILKI